MPKPKSQRQRRPVQLPADLWDLLWAEARKQPKATTPAHVAKEILYRHFGKKPRRKSL